MLFRVTVSCAAVIDPGTLTGAISVSTCLYTKMYALSFDNHSVCVCFWAVK